MGKLYHICIAQSKVVERFCASIDEIMVKALEEVNAFLKFTEEDKDGIAYVIIISVSEFCTVDCD